MSTTTEHRSRTLDHLKSVPCDYTTSLAFDLDIPKSTMRRVLDELEDEGLVVGTMHDERNTGGRRRIYWRLAA